MPRPILLLLLLALAAYAQSPDLPKTVRQGATIRVHAPAGAATARMAGRSVPLFPQPDGGALGLMPIPYDQKPGPYPLELLDKSGAPLSTATVTVLDAHFRKQNVTIQPQVAELKPSPDEGETVAAFRKTVSDARYWAEPLARPVPGCMTSPYGVARYLNGKPTGDYHGGLDLRAPSGTPIRATAAGIVKIVAEWNLHGRTVGIDHGQGLESIYLHMSKVAVAQGATVKKGDIIGYSGSTGRSNAPHLHWTIYVNGVSVNPTDWVRIPPCAPPSRSAKKK